MTKKALIAALAGCASITAANATVTVCLAARASGMTMPSIHRLQLSDGLAQSFLNRAVATLQTLHSDISSGERTLESYDAGNVPDKHEVEFHVLPAGSTPAAVVNALGALQQLPVFDGQPKTINTLAFHVVAIQRGALSTVYLFRKYWKTKELGRSKKLVTLFSSGTFDKITEPVFVFDESVDCISIDGKMIILKKDNYHRIFQFFEEALTRADQTLTQIQTAVPIDKSTTLRSLRPIVRVTHSF